MMCRSLYLFEEKELLESMQAFARELQRVEKGGKGFFYGTLCLDELLYFQLPRRGLETEQGKGAPDLEDLSSKAKSSAALGTSSTRATSPKVDRSATCASS